MKKILLSIFLLLSLASFGQAQVTLSPTNVFGQTVRVNSAGTASTAQSIANSGATAMKFVCYPSGTVTTAGVTLQTSDDGSTWTTTIASTDCSVTNASAVTDVTDRYWRINATTFSGTGNVDVAVRWYVDRIANLSGPGTCSANEVAYFTGASTLGCEAAFTYNPSTNVLRADALTLTSTLTMGTSQAINATTSLLQQIGGTTVGTWSAGSLGLTGTTAANTKTLTSTGTTTGYNLFELTNTGGAAYFGIAGSAAAGVLSGGVAYATIVATNNATDLQLGTNGTARATLAADGSSFALARTGGNLAATFITTTSGIAQNEIRGYNSSTTLADFAIGAGYQFQNKDTTNGNYTGILNVDAVGDNGNAALLFINDNHTTNAGSIAFLTRPASGSLTNIASFTSTGILTLVNAVAIGTTPAASGAVRLANGAEIVYRDQGDTGNVSAVRFTTANILSFGDSASGTFSGIVFNESGADVDIRMESDTNANHFVSDAGARSGVGAFGFGSAANTNVFLLVDNPAVTTADATSYYKSAILNSAAITVGTGTSAEVVTMRLDEPNIALNGNVVTDAYTLKVTNAPTEGTRNGALWVAAGHARFGATVSIESLTGATATHLCYDATSVTANYVGTCTSLRELKDDIQYLSQGGEFSRVNWISRNSALDTVMALKPASFRFKPSSDRVLQADMPYQYGFIAEDVYAVDPKLSTFYQGKLNGVNFDGVVSVLTKAVQELTERVKELERENSRLVAK